MKKPPALQADIKTPKFSCFLKIIMRRTCPAKRKQRRMNSRQMNGTVSQRRILRAAMTLRTQAIMQHPLNAATAKRSSSVSEKICLVSLFTTLQCSSTTHKFRRILKTCQRNNSLNIHRYSPGYFWRCFWNNPRCSLYNKSMLLMILSKISRWWRELQTWKQKFNLLTNTDWWFFKPQPDWKREAKILH